MLLNGLATSWSEVEITLLPALPSPLAPVIAVPLMPMKIPTVTSIDYKQSIDRSLVYGAGQYPQDMTKGIVKPETAKIVMGESDWITFWSLLGGQNGAVENQFNVQIMYTFAHGLLTPDIDTLQNCRFKSVSKQRKQGNEAQMVEVELDVLYINLGNPLLGMQPPSL